MILLPLKPRPCSNFIMPTQTLVFADLYNSAMRIGQDHVAATVNTLVLAYAGASLPMLLLFSLARGDYGFLINFSFIAEEIVRTLVGSLGLIAAVPLTTAIAILFAQRAESLGKWEQVLGPGGRRAFSLTSESASSLVKSAA